MKFKVASTAAFLLLPLSCADSGALKVVGNYNFYRHTLELEPEGTFRFFYTSCVEYSVDIQNHFVGGKGTYSVCEGVVTFSFNGQESISAPDMDSLEFVATNDNNLLVPKEKANQVRNEVHENEGFSTVVHRLLYFSESSSHSGDSNEI